MTDAPSPSEQRRWILASGLAAFLLYIFTASPTVYWLDSSELVAGAFELGITHPPGHALFVLLGKAASLIPIGSVAFRIHLLCGGLCGLGVGLTVALALRLWGRDARWTLPGLAALLAVSTPVWFHGVRAEVYPLQLVIGLLLVHIALSVHRDGHPRDVAVLGLVSGLAAANHTYLAVFMAPGLLVLILSAPRARAALRRGLSIGVLGLLLGMLPYLLLPLRAAAMTTVRWGDPGTLEGFWWLITARAFQKTAGRVQAVEPGAAVDAVGGWLAGNLGWLACLLAVLGLVWLARHQRTRALALTLFLAGNLGSQVLFDFDPANPDVGGYFLLSICLLGALSVGPLAAFVGFARERLPRVRLPVVALAVLVPILAALSLVPESRLRADLSWQRDTDHLADAIYAFSPADSLVVTSYFETIFNLWYRDAVAAQRPDVTIVHRLFRTYPGYDDYLRDRYPEQTEMLASPAERGQLDRDWLIAESATRSVLLEADPTLDPSLRPNLLPAGPLLALAPFPAPPWSGPLREADARFWARLDGLVDRGRRETAGNLLWIYVNQLLVFAGQGRAEAAHDRFERAWELAPGDPDLVEMGRSLGLEP